MTQETYEKYRALLNEGAITVHEFDQILLEDHDRRKANKPPQIKKIQICCVSVMTGAALTAVLSVLCIPPKPMFHEYDFGRAFLYLLGLGFWFLRGLIGGGCSFFLALYALRRFEDANEALGYATNYGRAKRVLLIAAVLLILFVSHQIFRYIHPLGAD